MRTVYTVNGFKGDCPRWAESARRMGQEVLTQRVLWFGPAWECPECTTGRH